MATTTNGKVIAAPIWGGRRPALLTSWSEIKKLGFRKRDRSFGFIENEDGTTSQALYFYAAKHCCSLSDEQLNKCGLEWYCTTETLDEYMTNQNNNLRYDWKSHGDLALSGTRD